MTGQRPVTSVVDVEKESAGGAATRVSGWQKVVGIGGLAVVVWVGLDSALFDAWFNDDTGGMPENMDHGPGSGPPGDGDQNPGGGPPEEDQEQDTDPSEGEHDPSQWDH